jgi:hypothetical protein
MVFQPLRAMAIRLPGMAVCGPSLFGETAAMLVEEFDGRQGPNRQMAEFEETGRL